jgi:hypothetical protein
MKYKVPALIAFSLFMSACKNHSISNNTPAMLPTDSIKAKQDFFPVADYIGGQLKLIDSFKLPLTASVIIGKDTALHAASYEELHELGKKFQHPDINDPTLKDDYTETNIADESVPSVTLIYAAKNSGLPLQKINVFVKPSAVENEKVTSVYEEKMFTINDTLFNQKLYWKAGKNMQVITEKKINGKTLPVEQVKITWDF